MYKPPKKNFILISPVFSGKNITFAEILLA
jgi:hypothetical protein